MNDEVHECCLCGHKGKDVEWQEHEYKSGYFCKDDRGCFES